MAQTNSMDYMGQETLLTEGQDAPKTHLPTHSQKTPSLHMSQGTGRRRHTPLSVLILLLSVVALPDPG